VALLTWHLSFETHLNENSEDNLHIYVLVVLLTAYEVTTERHYKNSLCSRTFDLVKLPW